MLEVFKKMDKFSLQVPQINIKGESHVSTSCGGIFSCFIFFLTLAYATHKSIEIVDARNPTINQNVVTSAFNSKDDYLDLKDSNFKMAFSLYDTVGRKTLNDTKHIQWIPTYTQKIDGKLYK